MPTRDLDHDAVVRALEADGWTITDDPLKREYGDRNRSIDLGAERSTVGAERSGRKIAVEIRSFLGLSPLRDLEEAVGQYQVDQAVLSVSIRPIGPVPGRRVQSEGDPLVVGLPDPCGV